MQNKPGYKEDTQTQNFGGIHIQLYKDISRDSHFKTQLLADRYLLQSVSLDFEIFSAVAGPQHKFEWTVW